MHFQFEEKLPKIFDFAKNDKIAVKTLYLWPKL